MFHPFLGASFEVDWRRLANLGEVRHAVIARYVRQPSPSASISRSKPVVRRKLGIRARAGVPAAPALFRSGHVVAAGCGPPDQGPEGGDQRLRLRAGDAPERAAGALRLHDLGRRRRGDAARESRGIRQVPDAAAPPRRREQGRHEHRDPRRALSDPDHPLSGLHAQGVPSGRRGRDRARREGRQSPADPFDPDHDRRRGGDGGARRADLVPALRVEPVGDRAGRW